MTEALQEWNGKNSTASDRFHRQEMEAGLKPAGQLPAAALLFLRGSLVFLPILKIRVMKLSGMVMKLSVLVFFFILFSHLFHFFFTHFGRAEGI